MINNTQNLDLMRSEAIKAMEKKITGKAEQKARKPLQGFNRLLDDAIRSNSENKKVDKKLMDVCIDMESIFVSKMLKEMRNTVHKTDWLHGGFAEEVFEDMLYDEYAKDISRNSNLGMAAMLYRELSQKI